jgi:hypothetical protein
LNWQPEWANPAEAYFCVQPVEELENTVLLSYTHRKNDFDALRGSATRNDPERIGANGRGIILFHFFDDFRNAVQKNGCTFPIRENHLRVMIKRKWK